MWINRSAILTFWLTVFLILFPFFNNFMRRKLSLFTYALKGKIHVDRSLFYFLNTS